MMQPSETEIKTEMTRIVAAYQARSAGASIGDRYSVFNAAALLHLQGLERHLLAMLKRHGLTRLADTRVLDVGCGGGLHLRRFIDYGATPAHLAGIDLLPQRIAVARERNPAIDWRIGSAHELPYPDASFDVVMSFVLFSSILSAALRQQIAAEMWRVLRPGGLILCHDFIYANPRNPAVRAFTPRQFRQLFDRPGARFAWQRLTLAPPLARVLAPRAGWLASMLERLKVFDTHMLASAWLPASLSDERARFY